MKISLKSLLWCVLFSVFILCVAMTNLSEGAGRPSIPNVLSFFTDVNNDLSKVIWGHAINEKEQLNQALTGKLK